MRRTTKLLIVGGAVALSVLWSRRDQGRTASVAGSLRRTDADGRRDSVVAAPRSTDTARSDTGGVDGDETAPAHLKQPEGPTRPPVDAEEERQRLLEDAAQHGVDQQEAIELAETVAQVQPLPDAYRAVDRRLATGYTLDEAEEILLGEAPNTRAEDDRARGDATKPRADDVGAPGDIPPPPNP